MCVCVFFSIGLPSTTNNSTDTKMFKNGFLFDTCVNVHMDLVYWSVRKGLKEQINSESKSLFEVDGGRVLKNNSSGGCGWKTQDTVNISLFCRLLDQRSKFKGQPYHQNKLVGWTLFYVFHLRIIENLIKYWQKSITSHHKKINGEKLHTEGSCAFRWPQHWRQRC